MQLNVFERENIAAIIPPQVGSIDEMILAAEIRTVLALTPEEKEEVEYTLDGGMPRWNPEKGDALAAECNLSPEQKTLIGKGFALLGAERRLPTSPQFFVLYQKFADTIPKNDGPH